MASNSLLVVGNDGQAAIINPGNGTSFMTASLPTNLGNGAMVDLQDGRVLYTGGDQGAAATSNAWIYDPNVQTWTLIGQMTTARTLHTATVMNDGRVLIAGGLPSDSVYPTVSALASAEIFDPTTNSFTATGSMNTARAWQTATLLQSNSVLVAGGATQNILPQYLASGEVFNPSSGTWTAVSNQMSVKRAGHTATLLDTGEVIIAGTILSGDPHGCGASPCTTTDLYDPTSNTFSPSAGGLNKARYDQAAVKMVDNTVLVTGGCCDIISPLQSAETFDETTSTWTTVASMQQPRSGQAAVLLTDGQALIVGGTTSSSSTEFYQQQSPLGSFVGVQLPAALGTVTATALWPRAANQMPIAIGSAGYNITNSTVTTVRVCVPGTTNCVTVNSITVDSGSTGFRVFSSKLGGVSLPAVNVAGGVEGDCESYVSSTIWGPVATADVYVGTEKLTMPIQIIDDTNSFAPVPASCSATGTITDTPSSFGENGLIGINPYPNDRALYYSCSGNSCFSYFPKDAEKVRNPVAQLPADNNGSIVDMQALGVGQQQVAAYGWLYLGIGTETNNQPPSGIQVFTSDSSGELQTTYSGNTVTSLFDTGTTYLSAFSAATFGTVNCSSSSAGAGFYCPSSLISTSATVSGKNGTTADVPFEIANGTALVSTPSGQPSTFALSQLAGPGGLYFNWGVVGFFGRPIFIALDGASTPLGTGPFDAF
ncbi:MAG TPA: DUF3443 family protein [Candidatus Binataceae bacterium]|nr:DUF3443 family protein [Candidatus Binataceae bacterium]